jgi:propanol-preferring alcohol dehydrogenase
MQAMVLDAFRQPLKLVERPDVAPAAGEVAVRIEACAVCRTDLHVIDGELPQTKLPIVPGHEIVGVVEAVGAGVEARRIGRRVGIPWLGRTCGRCRYCREGRENLCDTPEFTGCTRNGGFATRVAADARFAFDLDPAGSAISIAPLLCGDAPDLGIYGFGAAAHIIAQIAIWQGRRIFAFTRSGDGEAQAFALSLGAAWAGGSDEMPPTELDAAIIFAPVGALVPAALAAVRKGGRVVCGGIHMSDIPAMPYGLLWEERELVSVANLTRDDARQFLPLARQAGVKTQTTVYPLQEANRAIADLRAGKLIGAAVLVPA